MEAGKRKQQVRKSDWGIVKFTVDSLNLGYSLLLDFVVVVCRNIFPCVSTEIFHCVGISVARD